MSSRRPATGAVLRRFTLGSGPLKRTSDRLQHLGRILLVCVLLFGVAVALAVATTAYTEARAEAAAQAGTRHQVKAELTSNARASEVEDSTADGWGSASVSWRDDVGALHHDVLSVAAGAKSGSTVLLWVDRAGNRTPPPITAGDAVYAGVGYGLLAYLAISGAAAATYQLFRRSLDRSRARRWASEWAYVEPLWSRMLP